MVMNSAILLYVCILEGSFFTLINVTSTCPLTLCSGGHHRLTFVRHPVQFMYAVSILRMGMNLHILLSEVW